MSFFLFIALGIGSLFAALRRRHPQHATFLITLFSLAFILRLIVGGFFYSKLYWMAKDGFFAGDEGLYFYKGHELYELSRTTDLEELRITLLDYQDPYKFKFAYPFNFVTLLHFFIFTCFGVSVLYTKIFAMAVGSLTPILFYFFCNRLFGKKVASVTAILFSFWPSFFFYSLGGFKETYLMFVVVSLFTLSERLFEKKAWYTLSFIPLLGILTLLVSDYIFSLFLFFSCFVFLIKSAPRYRKTLATLAVIVLLVSPFIAPKNKLGELVQKQLNVALIDHSGYYLYPHIFFKPSGGQIGDEDALFKEGRLIPSSWSFILVKGLLYALFSPFLWSIRSLYQLASYPQMVFILLGCLFVIRGGCLALRHQFSLFFPLLYTMVIFIIGHALTEGNMGAALRHRELFLPSYLLFFSVGLFRS